nr:hypothetical protein [Clostridia bacterium]
MNVKLPKSVERALAVLLSVLLVAGTLPLGVITTRAAEPDWGYAVGYENYGTGIGTYEPAADGSISIGSSGTTLQWFPADAGVGRTRDGWWISFRMFSPETYDTDSATIESSKDNADWDGYGKFFAAKDGTEDGRDYVIFWQLVTPERLASAGEGAYTVYYRFNWDTERTQVVTLEIDPNDLTLRSEDGSYDAWPYSWGSAEVLDGTGAVTGAYMASSFSNGAVTIDGDECTPVLEWVEKNAGGVDRPKDGWWFGVRLHGAANCAADAELRISSDNSTWSDPWTFADVVEPGEDYVDFWLYLDPAALSAAGGKYTRYFKAKWDEYRTQTFTLELDTADMTLKNADDSVAWPYPVGTVSDLLNLADGTDTDGNVYLTASDLTLEWLTPEDDPGIANAGWYVGFTITVPGDIDYADARYGRGKPGTTFARNKTFSGASRLIRETVTPATIEDYKALGQDYVIEYDFEWAADRIQKVFIDIDCTGGTITLVDGDEQIYPDPTVSFQNGTDPAVPFEFSGQIYTFTALYPSNENISGVVYELVSAIDYDDNSLIGTADEPILDEATGELLIRCPGFYFVRARALNDIGAPFGIGEICYLMVYRLPQSTLSFTGDYSDLTWEDTVTLATAGGSGTGAVSYEIVGATDLSGDTELD